MTEARGADQPPVVSRGEIAALVTKMGTAVATLARADHAAKQALYEQVGLRLTYYPQDRTVIVEAGPGRHVRDGVSEGGLRRMPHKNAAQRGDARHVAGHSRWVPAAHRGRLVPRRRAVDKNPHASTGQAGSEASSYQTHGDRIVLTDESAQVSHAVSDPIQRVWDGRYKTRRQHTRGPSVIAGWVRL